jgi:hypothetical protein
MTECKQYFSTALVTFGEFGANDYSFILQAGVGVQEVQNKYVPQVIQLISAAVEVNYKDNYVCNMFEWSEKK